jgi:hypothetical protein
MLVGVERQQVHRLLEIGKQGIQTLYLKAVALRRT